MSEQLNSVSLEADFLFMRCIPHLDVEGRMTANPEVVFATACPLRPVLLTRVEGMLTELEDVGLLARYQVSGKRYMFFPGFERSQVGLRKDREAASNIPEPPPELLRSCSAVNDAEEKGSEGKLSEVNRNGPDGPVQSEQYRELCWFIEQQVGSKHVWRKRLKPKFDEYIARYTTPVLIGLLADRDFHNPTYALKAFLLLDEHESSAWIQAKCRERYYELKQADWKSDLSSSVVGQLIVQQFPQPDSYDPEMELKKLIAQHGPRSQKAKDHRKKWNHLLTH